MEILISVLQLIIIFGGWFLVKYIKKLPDQLHAKNLKVFENKLNKQLEVFKNELTTDLELMKINESQLHIHKTEEFTKLVEVLIVKMLDKDYVAQLGKNQRVTKEYNQTMLNLGTKLFFFASDNTVKKFVEWRKYNLSIEGTNFDPKQIIILLAELIVEIRKDVGYEDTICNKHDFLHIMLTDWHKYENQ
ncbi:hypothetical protein [Priestia megaterium]|uniref:hypothetical protein n=1 Tax=Priestia megaterium TaxID=1404 RepID=UPI002E1FF7A8|nr:hypothetical protein [Priestia megaterium]